MTHRGRRHRNPRLARPPQAANPTIGRRLSRHSRPRHAVGPAVSRARRSRRTRIAAPAAAVVLPWWPQRGPVCLPGAGARRCSRSPRRLNTQTCSVNDGDADAEPAATRQADAGAGGARRRPACTAAARRFATSAGPTTHKVWRPPVDANPSARAAAVAALLPQRRAGGARPNRLLQTCRDCLRPFGAKQAGEARVRRVRQGRPADGDALPPFSPAEPVLAPRMQNRDGGERRLAGDAAGSKRAPRVHAQRLCPPGGRSRASAGAATAGPRADAADGLAEWLDAHLVVAVESVVGPGAVGRRATPRAAAGSTTCSGRSMPTGAARSPAAARGHGARGGKAGRRRRGPREQHAARPGARRRRRAAADARAYWLCTPAAGWRRRLSRSSRRRRSSRNLLGAMARAPAARLARARGCCAPARPPILG